MITGASGLVGYPIACHLATRGHEVITLGRTALPDLSHIDWSLGDEPQIPQVDVLIHAAFAHVPGRYRGGEGDDPTSFLRKNLDGTLRLFDAAQSTNARVIFTSSRAVYGDYPPGTALGEAMEPRPNTLYGKAKLKAERALAGQGISLRITGVYGDPVPGKPHKWTDLFNQFQQGEKIEPRISTEVHAHDVAKAVALLLNTKTDERVFNLSDFALDRRVLLETYSEITGVVGQLPDREDASCLNAMTTSRLRQLGWHPRGLVGLRETLETLANN